MLKPGDITTYREDDWVARVEVLENNSDERERAFTLRVVETLEASRRYVTPENGHEFEAQQLRSYGSRVWHMEGSTDCDDSPVTLAPAPASGVSTVEG